MTKADLLIRGGSVADGGGGPLYEADIAISDGRIVEIGALSTMSGREEIDAAGLLVTPGFVDVHTHYDGQAAWDERLAPSSFHGVTTAVMGNCGVGFAPVRASDRERVIELMEGVEDIPGVVLHQGIDWRWQSFPEYLAFLAGRSYDMDIAAQLPHAPLRVFVMGDRACRLEEASEADIAEMRRLATEAMRAGAIGFSTSRSLNHKSITGDPTPSLRASEAELLGIARGMADAGGGVLEMSSDFDREVRGQEFAMIRRIVEETGLSFSFGLSQKNSDPNGWRELLGLVRQARADGLPIRGQVAPRPVGSVMMLEASSIPFRASSTYSAVINGGGSLKERVARLRDPEVRRKVLEETRAAGLGIVGTLGGLERLFLQRGPVNYEPRPDQSVAQLSIRDGKDPVERIYDQMTGDDGQDYIYFPVNNYSDFTLEPVRELIAAEGETVIGLGDGGAHVGLISDASFPTFLLSYWGRDRETGRFDVGRLVKRHTADTAALVGLHDRGRIALGLKADLNIIDFDRLGLEAPVMAHDLPAGGARLLQRARGYVATIVSGQIVYRNGEPTGALPGKLVRGPAAGRL